MKVQANSFDWQNNITWIGTIRNSNISKSILKLTTFYVAILAQRILFYN